jgi:hypothetical protein
VAESLLHEDCWASGPCPRCRSFRRCAGASHHESKSTLIPHLLGRVKPGVIFDSIGIVVGDHFVEGPEVDAVALEEGERDL